jgi:UDP-glucose 4-epimerase
VRRILVTGTEASLGRRVAARLAARADTELVIGADTRGEPVGDSVEVVALGSDYRGVADVLTRREIDTIVHARLARPRTGSMAAGVEADVIGTMHLAAAAARRDGPVRHLVVASSATVYPAAAEAPVLHTEWESLTPPQGSVAAGVVEAENYVRDLADAYPHLWVCILRLADLIGGDRASRLASLLGAPVVPALWGYDPWVHLLDVDDAAAALEHALEAELIGLYNVAGDSPIRWRRAARLARRPVAELLPVRTAGMESFLRFLRVPYVPDDLFDVLRFGRSLDTAVFTRTGFQPARTTEDCVRELVPGPSTPSPLPAQANLA